MTAPEDPQRRWIEAFDEFARSHKSSNPREFLTRYPDLKTVWDTVRPVSLDSPNPALDHLASRDAMRLAPSPDTRLDETIAHGVTNFPGLPNDSGEGSGPRRDQDSASNAAMPSPLPNHDSNDRRRLLLSGGSADRSSWPRRAVDAELDGTPLRVFGEYELMREVARGGMGVVYLARQVKLNRVVALKMIRAAHTATPDELLRFLGEAELAAWLDHPGIVPVYDTGEHEGQLFFAMKYIRGETLAEQTKTRPLPSADAARIVMKVARAIQYAHDQGVIHRDLKPSNILVDEHGEPHVTDFGLAKLYRDDAGMTTTGQLMGTPSYMAPEQVGSQAGVGPAVDVYGLGSTLYCTLTGRPPFQAANVIETLNLVRERDPVAVRQLNPAVDRDLETITLKCLEKSPRQRYASADAVADDLARYLDGQPIQARTASLWERGWKWARRHPALAMLVLLWVLSMVGQVAVQILLFREVSSSRVLNVAGRQRMLSQRICKASLASLTLDDPAARRQQQEAFRESLKQWQRAHCGLRFGDDELGLPAPPSETIRARLVALNGVADALADIAARMATAGETAEARRTAIEQTPALLAQESEFLRRMEEIVGLFEAQSRGRVETLRYSSMALQGLTLLGLPIFLLVSRRAP